MNMTFEELLSGTVKENMIHLLSPELNEWEERVCEKRLSRKDTSKLADFICSLPQSGQHLILGTYAFGLTPESIEILYGISDAGQRLKFFEKMLAREMGLASDERISEDSLTSACKTIISNLSKETATTRNTSNIVRIFTKTAAAILIAGIISFGTAYSVNAEFREAVTKWFIETFKEYSLIRFDNTTISGNNLEDYRITYVPERFSFDHIDKADSLISHSYLDADGYYLSIDIELPGGNNYVDTENTQLEILDFRGHEARYYSKENYSLLVTELDGYALFISGPVTKDEILKIVNGIEK
ncbi:DUF4367 domain-containing protein [Butyrivibrio sp. AC2005]|uniref:DUF4367 domain-containing protein n=1 Tax=Butyrivibrio sp. AC2005 TaxID=1280672 RepID=UPI0003FD55F2|nr:DUF4367 domain-containing protein [Butyrivibrio sp. AC2005]